MEEITLVEVRRLKDGRRMWRNMVEQIMWPASVRCNVLALNLFKACKRKCVLQQKC